MNLNLKEGKIEEKSTVRNGLYVGQAAILSALESGEYGQQTMAVLIDTATVGPDRLKLAGALSDKASLFVGPKASGIQCNCNVFFPLSMTGFKAEDIHPRDYKSPATIAKQERAAKAKAK